MKEKKTERHGGVVMIDPTPKNKFAAANLTGENDFNT